MEKYLYGANIKGVQQFIFQTGKLTEIIGASEIVEDICNTFFKEQILTLGISIEKYESNRIVTAAGIIKFVFDNKEKCENFVRTFPKNVYNKAPHIIFNQVVVKITKNKPNGEDFKNLEERLKTQRNKNVAPTESGLRITERSRRTGLPGIKFSKNEVLDNISSLKQEAAEKKQLNEKLSSEGISYEFPSNIDEIKSKHNSFVAIIHADGNNLGKTIRALNEKNANLSTSELFKLNKDFSSAIDQITLTAAKNAINKTFNGSRKIPLRPVIIGGDDFTVICNAEYALELTKNYLSEFETESGKVLTNLGLHPITSCAGIAYIKANYPFHYGVKLAEDLCGFSKYEAKQIDNTNVPSCLTFHRVLSSFIGDYKNDIIKRELTATAAGLNFCGGPYFVSNHNTTIQRLLEMVECLKDKNTPVSKLSKWIYTCYVSKYLAIEDLKRIIQILEESQNDNIISTLELQSLLDQMNNGRGIIKTSLYDAIIINSLN